MCPAPQSKTPERPVIQQEQDKWQRHQRGFAHQTKDEKNQDKEVSARGRSITARKTRIGPKSEHEEYAAEHVFPFGYPCDRSHMERVNRKQGRDQRTWPKRAGQSPQREKQENCRGGMQPDVRPMMSPWLKTVELAIQHVRQRGERMPVVGMHTGEGPPNSVRREARADPRILVNVFVVVVVDELVSQRLAKDNPHDRHEQETDETGENGIAPSTRGALLRRVLQFFSIAADAP